MDRWSRKVHMTQGVGAPSVWPAVISPKILSLSFVRFTLNEFEVRNKKIKKRKLNISATSPIRSFDRRQHVRPIGTNLDC